MATYRFEAKIIGRAKGRSATASAAYRAGQRVEDRRTGEVFDYSRMRGVLHSEIMAPDNTPAWMLKRAELWNAVETVEKRKDAQVARDLVLSLPHELTHTQRIELVREFLREEFVGRGMIADFSIHAPDRKGDNRNHHAHVMLTMRELTGDGFGKKVRAWNDTDLLEHWREHWAHAVNRHLERNGHSARVDHRSNIDQGLERVPEPKQGPVATEMEREGRVSHAGEDRRAVQARNAVFDEIAAELRALRAEVIDLEEEREKRRAEDRSWGVRVATEDGGLVAQQREALSLAAARERGAPYVATPDPRAPKENPLALSVAAPVSIEARPKSIVEPAPPPLPVAAQLPRVPVKPESPNTGSVPSAEVARPVVTPAEPMVGRTHSAPTPASTAVAPPVPSKPVPAAQPQLFKITYQYPAFGVVPPLQGLGAVSPVPALAPQKTETKLTFVTPGRPVQSPQSQTPEKKLDIDEWTRSFAEKLARKPKGRDDEDRSR